VVDAGIYFAATHKRDMNIFRLRKRGSCCAFLYAPRPRHRTQHARTRIMVCDRMYAVVSSYSLVCAIESVWPYFLPRPHAFYRCEVAHTLPSPTICAAHGNIADVHGGAKA